MCRWGSGWLRIAGLFVGVALAAALPAVAAVGGVTPLPGSTTGASTGSAWANLPAGAQTTISSALLTEGVDLVEQAKLTASDGSSNESFGQSVAIDGDTIVVGVPYDAVGANGYQGSVYVFTRPAGGWSTGTQVAKLTASDGGSWEYFAESVAIDGDTVVVGSPGDTISGNFSQGSAYIFTRPASGWASGTEAAKLTAADGTSSARFGQAVAIDGDTIVVGAPGDSIGGSYSQGAAYTFSRPAEGWASGTEAAKLTASTRSSNDYFAQSVAIDGDVIVVGSPGHTAGTNWSQGSAYVFTRPAGGWSSGTEAATLTASDGSTFDQLAGAVAIDGDTIAAGATADSIGPNWYQGSVYVFTKPDGGWSSATELAKLTASDGTSGDALGGRLVIDGDTIAAGARDSDVGTNDSQGSVYVFTRPTGGWSSGVEAAKLTASDGSPYDDFGSSIAMRGGTLVVGAFGDDVGSNPNQGSAYVFGEPNLVPEGTHDAVEGLAPDWACGAAGWAVDPDDRYADLPVRILVDEEVIAETIADQFRPDLLEAGVSPDGYSAFELNLWDLAPMDGGHQIRVQAQDAQTFEWVDLNLTPKSMGCHLRVVSQVAELLDTVSSSSLRDKLRTVLRHYEAGRFEQAVDNLEAFINQVTVPSSREPAETTLGNLRAAEQIKTWIKVAAGMVPGGVTGWWPADGSPSDLAGGRTAVLVGDVGYVAGVDRQAFFLDGDGDFVAVPDAPGIDPGTRDFAVSLWVKFDTLSGEQVLAEKYIEQFDGNRSTGWTLTKLEGNEIGLALGSGGGGLTSPPQKLKPGVWYQFAARRSGNDFTVLRDGNVIAAGTAGETFTGDLTTVAALKFGHRGNPDDTPGSLDDSNYWLHGAIDEAQIVVGRALSDAEIRAIYEASQLGEPITDRGHVVVTVATDPDGSGEGFRFDSSWSAEPFIVADGQYSDSGPLLPGTYSVSEAIPDGWNLTNAVCSDGSALDEIVVAAGEVVICTFSNRALARIVVEKQTRPVGSALAFEFFPSWGPAFELRDGEAHDSGFLDPGTYSVSEAVPEGWSLASLTCSDGSPNGEIEVSAAEVVTCTFRNEAYGRIVVMKETDPAGSPYSFSFSWSWYPWWFGLRDGEHKDSGLVPEGTYSVYEQSSPPGWELASATCSDGSAPSSISLDPGEVVTCTFINRAQGRITVVKQTDPDGAAGTFVFFPSWDPLFALGDGGSRTWYLGPGSYSLSEEHRVGWTIESATCSDGSPVSAIVLAAGEDVTCTFSNRRTGGTITIVKETEPDGVSQNFWFVGRFSAGFSLSDGGSGSWFLDPGTYWVSEVVPPGWTLSDASCSDGSPITAIDLSGGEHVTCTFRNVQALPPLTPPMSPPISPPISRPVTPPVCPPISGPISPPISGDVAAEIGLWDATADCPPQPLGPGAILDGAQASLVGSMAAGIVSFSLLASLASPLVDRVRRRARGW